MLLVWFRVGACRVAGFEVEVARRSLEEILEKKKKGRVQVEAGKGISDLASVPSPRTTGGVVQDRDLSKRLGDEKLRGSALVLMFC